MCRLVLHIKGGHGAHCTQPASRRNAGGFGGRWAFSTALALHLVGADDVVLVASVCGRAPRWDPLQGAGLDVPLAACHLHCGEPMRGATFAVDSGVHHCPDVLVTVSTLVSTPHLLRSRSWRMRRTRAHTSRGCWSCRCRASCSSCSCAVPATLHRAPAAHRT
jgi:hypothetical protein